MSGATFASAPPPAADAAGLAPPGDELSPAAEQAMWAEIQRNLEVLRASGALAAPDAAQAVAYDFPLRLAPGLSDYAGFYVSAFVDHNPAGGQVLDYNGGARTYDGHRGTDYALYPFNWNKVDAGEVQVVAAAAGTIVGNSNVDPTDHNCNTSSSDPWNYVALTHADGRMTIYGHMRYNSLTSKGIGQTVAQGEYLGLVASSGNSSGPHLHFEVRFGGFTNAEWIDPYAGPSSQPESLWASQRPYPDSAINKLATHSAPPSAPDPCKPAVTNLQDRFATPANIYFYTYYRDYQPALTTQLNIYRPDGSVFQSWQDVPAAGVFYSVASRARAFNFSANEPAGVWRFEASYNGQVYTTTFSVNLPGLSLAQTASVPNPPPGGPIQYIVTIANNGLGPATGARLTVPLPAGLTQSGPVTLNPPGLGAAGALPDAVTGLRLAAGQSLTVTIPVFVDQGQPAGVRITTTATLTSVESLAPLTATTVITLADAPLTARDDFALTPVDTPVTVDILGNDGDPNGDPATITALGAPLTGTASLLSSKLVYTPTAGFLGADVFTYTVSTGAEQASATVTVVVAAQVLRLFLPLVRR